MIGIFINLPDDLIKQIKQYIQPTPTAEIMKAHIKKWTRKSYFHQWFREHYYKVVRILSSRSYLRMKYIKQRQDDIIKLLKSKGEKGITIEKLIHRNYLLSKSYKNNASWLFVE